MSREALRQLNIDGLQLILTASSIASIIALTARQLFHAKQQKNLKQLAAVILKDVCDAVLRCEILIRLNSGPKL